MQLNDDFISKNIVTADGEKDFQVRYIRDENAGIITTATNKSYFLLDSGDYWYDLIQEKYPPALKCSCKNDRFNLTFGYTPREDTEDFKAVNITCRCTVCQKPKKLSTIKIDYSPSSGIFESPITFCKQPKIKYKTYSLKGYWSEKELLSIAGYFLQNNLFVYCWYWNSELTQRFFKELSADELNSFLTGNNARFIAIYFSQEPLDALTAQASSDEKGILVPHDIWRKKCIFLLHGPCAVMSYGMFYSMDFCSEYLDKSGNIVKKPASFCALVQSFQKFSKKLI